MSIRRRLALVVMPLALMMMIAAAGPASADPQAVVVAGTAALTAGFNNTGNPAPGCFAGTSAGTTSGAVTADFIYENHLADGSATGALNFSGTAHDVNFTWVRVGLTAVLTLNNATHTGAAVAAFAPVGPPNIASPGCSGANAQVVGAGVLL